MSEANETSDLAALVPSIEAELFAPLDPFGTGRIATLDERLRPLVHSRLVEWANTAASSRAAGRDEQLAAAWAQELDDTATYGGPWTAGEKAGLLVAARLMRDPAVQAQVRKAGGGSCVSLTEDLAADMCDQGRRPARTAYHPGPWDEVSRRDAEGFRERAAEIVAKVQERAASRDDRWFHVDLAADLADACVRPRRKKFSTGAWQQAKTFIAGNGGTAEQWWIDYAVQVIDRVLGDRGDQP